MTSGGTHTGALMAGWRDLPSDLTTDAIAPGWKGPGSGEDFKKWIENLDDTRHDSQKVIGVPHE